MGMPIRARLTVVFAALIVVVLIVAGFFIYGGLRAQLDGVIHERVAALARELAADLEDGESGVLHDFGEGDSKGFFAQVLDGERKVVEVSGAIGEPLLQQTELAKGEAGNVLQKSVTLAGGEEPAPAFLIVAPASGNRYVVVGKQLDERNAALDKLALLLWLAGPALAIVASLLAWLLSGAALRPVEELRKQASLISESDLARRLPVPATGDEVATLARTLNAMLARLEEAFERERRFVDDASHELRTPLGILKTELDLALRRSRTKEELKAALISASEESERLNRLAEDLLVLARADRGKLPLKRETVNAEELLTRTTARFAIEARERGVALDVSAPAGLAIDVDALRMQQALGNLIANALAHTPRGGRIAVAALIDGARELVLAVSDSGAGFPTGFIKTAFDPFTRADPGRSRREGGAGLGLAIVKGVAEAHGGSAMAANRPKGGAVVTLRIPQ